MSIKTRNGVPVEVEKKPMRFCAMIRCSTRKQATKGNSFENQSQIIENFVQAKGGEIIKTFQVQESGKDQKLNKGVLAEVLTFSKDNDCEVVAASFTRFSRDAESLWKLRNQLAKGVNVWIAEQNRSFKDISTAEFGMLSTYAQVEREISNSRIKASKFKSKGYFNSDNASDNAKKSVKSKQDRFKVWAEQVNLCEKIAYQVTKTGKNLAEMVGNMNGLCMTQKSDTKAPQGNWGTISGEAWSYHNLRKTIIKLGYNSLDDFVWRYMLKNDSEWKKGMGRLR